MTTLTRATAPAVTGATPADRLRAAAAYLDTHGWHQGGYHDETSNAPCPPACAAGAIMITTHPTGFTPASSLGELFHPSAEARAALYLLAAYLIETTGREQDTQNTEDVGAYGEAEVVIGDWNDEDGRTLTDIVTALHEAADDWDRVHRGATDAAATPAH
jgi:hypothetical protein